MINTDIRWKQRLYNYKRAHLQLQNGVALMRQRELSNLEKQGLVQAFEFTYELAWKMLKEYLSWQGIKEITGSRDAIREAFAHELIDDGEAWMNMLVDRNQTSHTYNEATVEEILTNIDQRYAKQFFVLREKFDVLAAKN